jgi:hypothetical protein
MTVTGAELLVAEAVAAERAKTANEIAEAIEAEQNSSTFRNVVLKRAARIARSFAAGSETTKEDGE